MNRLTETDYPAGWGTGMVYYTDTPGSISVEQKRLDSGGGVWNDTFDLFDGMFHTASHSVANGEAVPWDRSDTCYDGDARTLNSIYPYQASTNTGAPGCTAAGDSFVYDALGRVRTVTHSDSSVVATAYAGRAADVQDEGNGTSTVEHIMQSDALGRLTNVCEVTGQAQNNVAPSSCGLDYPGTGFLTAYSYDASGNLTNVAQGSESRGFSYDLVSRLTQANNPESGTTSYLYDADSSCPQPTYAGELISRTDARGIKTCMQYDALRRLTAKTYSDGTPSATYGYDETASMGVSLSNTTGRMSSESTAGSSPTGAVFSYDSMGHVIDNSQCTPQNCGTGVFPVSYGGYSVLGSPGTATNGVGVTLSYGYNTAGRLTSLQSSPSDDNHPGTLLNDVHYNAYGSPVSSVIGTFPLTDTRTYTPRNWISTISVSGPATPSTGTVTINGNEGNRLNSSATPGTGSVTIGGSEQSTSVQTSPGSPSSVTMYVGGSEQSVCLKGTDGGTCELYRYDAGSVTITINGCTTTASYGEASTANSVASALASGFSCSTVTLAASGTTFVFTSTAYSSSADYSFTTSSKTNYPSNFSSPSFSVIPLGEGTMSGGASPTYTTVYDSGTAAITVNGHADSYSWGSGATAGSVASGLASAINSDGSAPVSASLSGATVNLTTKATGAGTGYSLSASTSFNSSYFGSPSFSLGAASALSSGSNAAYTYDTGTVSLVVNGITSSASYGQNDDGSTVAAALASALSATTPSVTASASGNMVTLTSTTEGAYTNYSLSASSSSSNGFSPASFSPALSGSAMTGGTGSAIYSASLSYEPDGDVQSSSDLINGSWNYTYDSFNRLNTAVSNTGLGCSEVYDLYGNRLAQNNDGGTCYTPQHTSSGNNNRLDGFSYDAAGNLLNDGVHNYSYDAEGRLSAVDGGATASYVYDAEGRRVRRSASGAVDYLYDPAGHVITEVSAAGTWKRGEVYAGGQHVATYMDGTTLFNHSDWLGTERVRSTLAAGCTPPGPAIRLAKDPRLPTRGLPTSPAKNAMPNQGTTTSGQGTMPP